MRNNLTGGYQEFVNSSYTDGSTWLSYTDCYTSSEDEYDTDVCSLTQLSTKLHADFWQVNNTIV